MPGDKITLLADLLHEDVINVKTITDSTTLYEITGKMYKLTVYATATYVPNKTLIQSEHGPAFDFEGFEENLHRTRAPTGTWSWTIDCNLELKAEDDCVKIYGTPSGVPGEEGASLTSMAGSGEVYGAQHLSTFVYTVPTQGGVTFSDPYGSSDGYIKTLSSLTRAGGFVDELWKLL